MRADQLLEGGHLAGHRVHGADQHQVADVRRLLVAQCAYVTVLDELGVPRTEPA